MSEPTYPWLDPDAEVSSVRVLFAGAYDWSRAGDLVARRGNQPVPPGEDPDQYQFRLYLTAGPVGSQRSLMLLWSPSEAPISKHQMVFRLPPGSWSEALVRWIDESEILQATVTPDGSYTLRTIE